MGTTYHAVTVYLDGKCVFSSGKHYGYGEGWLQTAVDWLRQNGYPDAEYGTRYLREVLGGTYSVSDVARERDL